MNVSAWNIEWMHHFFVKDQDRLKKSHSKSLYDVPDLASRVGEAIRSLDPDVLILTEGPQHKSQMEFFVDEFLDGEYDVHGGHGRITQQVYGLVRRNGPFENAHIPNGGLERDLRRYMHVDTNADGKLEKYRFTRHPMILDGVYAGDGSPVSTIGLHLKSKHIRGGRKVWEKNPDEFRLLAARNRRRIIAEGQRVHKYAEALIEDDPNRYVIIGGDINDGPGKDLIEEQMLLGDAINSLVGNIAHEDGLYIHPIIEHYREEGQLGLAYTARFADYTRGGGARGILLDHIIVSPNLKDLVTDAGVAHEIWNNTLDHSAEDWQRQHATSDHRPVYIQLGD